MSEILQILYQLNSIVEDPIKTVFAIIILFLIWRIIKEGKENKGNMKYFEDTQIKQSSKVENDWSIKFGGVVFKRSRIATYSNESKKVKRGVISHE